MKNKENLNWTYWPFIVILFLFAACKKSNNTTGMLDRGVVVSLTDDINDHIRVDSFITVPVTGGLDTIYAFSNTDLSVLVNGDIDWLKIVDLNYDQKSKATRIIFSSEPLTNNYVLRRGELNISNQEPFSRFFLNIRQGYTTYLREDFSWLRYGHGDPLDLISGVLWDSWTPTQKEYNWKPDQTDSDIPIVFGKYGYVQIGSEDVGGNLLTPIITGVQADSIMMVSFNAVAYMSNDETKDNNNLTIELLGGQFEDGSTKTSISLDNFDSGSSFLSETMWKNSFYSFKIFKDPEELISTTLQIGFVNGTGDIIGDAKNRIFLDNVFIYSVEKYAPKVNDEQ